MIFSNTTIRSVWLILIVLMTACSSPVPPEIRQTLNNSPSVAQVRGQPDSHISQQIRWGGTILETENRENTSWLTIIAYPLTDSGKPRTSAQSSGRFIAIVNEFLEPSLYSSDRLITVRGSFLKTETLEIGEYPYVYPLIEVDHYYLWPKIRTSGYVGYSPYWGYDPWFYPYNPWHHQHRHFIHRHHNVKH